MTREALSATPTDEMLLPQQLIEQEISTERLEEVPVSSLVIEGSLVDPGHVRELAESMSGERGQISPLTVRARSNEQGIIVYDIIDGYHRANALKELERIWERPIMAACTVVYGCNDEELYDLRVLAASSVSSVKFARMAEWMTNAFKVASWENERIATLITSDRLSILQVFGLAMNDSSGIILKLTPQEALELKTWARNKAKKWGRPIGSIAVELRTIEQAAPDLVKKVSKRGGGKKGKGVLTHARLGAIASQIPGEYGLQRTLVAICLSLNFDAKEIGIIAAEIADAISNCDDTLVDRILKSPHDYLSAAKERQNEMSSTKGIIYRGRKCSQDVDFIDEPDLDANSVRHAGDEEAVDDLLSVVAVQELIIRYLRSDQQGPVTDQMIKLMETRLERLGHGGNNSQALEIDGSYLKLYCHEQRLVNLSGRDCDLTGEEAQLLMVLNLLPHIVVGKELFDFFGPSDIPLEELGINLREKLMSLDSSFARKIRVEDTGVILAQML